MANGKQDQWTPPLWCRACGREYRRFVGGLRECCARCSVDINKLEAILRREEASGQREVSGKDMEATRT